MNLRNAILDILTGAAALSAVAMVGITLHRNASPRTQATSMTPPRKVTNASLYAASGHRIGPSNARVTLVEFGDFQCPACGVFYQTMKKVQATHPKDVAIVFRHFPLTYHQHAYPAARASECAARQGRFSEMYEVLYSHQSALGTKPLNEFAIDANVSDTAAFGRCVSQNERMAEIDSDIETGRKLGVSATPGILINDLLYSGALTEATIEKLVMERLSAHN